MSSGKIPSGQSFALLHTDIPGQSQQQSLKYLPAEYMLVIVMWNVGLHQGCIGSTPTMEFLFSIPFFLKGDTPMYLNFERKPNCYPISVVVLEGCLSDVDKTRDFGKSKEVTAELSPAAVLFLTLPSAPSQSLCVGACIHLLRKVKLLCLHPLYSTHFSLIQWGAQDTDPQMINCK